MKRCLIQFSIKGARYLQMLPPSLLDAPNISVFRGTLKKDDLFSMLHICGIT